MHDRLGRRQDVRAVRVAGGRRRWSLYFLVPAGSNTTLLLVGFPLGFFASGCFSGFGSYLAELFPTRARGTGGGFCYNVGRGIGALFPGIIGFLAAAIGLGGAIAFGVFGYVLAICALAVLPETHGREFAPPSDELADALRRRPRLRPRAAALRRRADVPGARAGRGAVRCTAATSAARPRRARAPRRCW